MKAVICTRYGSIANLRVVSREKPEPGAHEIRIRIAAAAVTAGDCEVRRFDFPPTFRLPLRLAFGVTKPRNEIMGFYLSGTVDAVGERVTRFSVESGVFGFTGMQMGAFAEYVCLPESALLASKPAELGHPEATTVPIGGLNALHFLRLARIQPGEQVLVIGAGGTFGTYAIQLARHFGAEVTGVDRGDKLDFLRDTGAHHVIDYTSRDFSEERNAYDVIFDVPRTTRLLHNLRALKPGGRYLLTNPTVPAILQGLWASRTSGRKVIMKPARERVEDMGYLVGLVREGAIHPVMDRQYPLEELAEAQRYVESGKKRGNVVVTMSPNGV